MTTATLFARTARTRRSLDVDVLRTVLTALFLLPYALGRLAGAVVTAALWVWAAMVVGWRDGRGSDRKDVTR
jgi:hypothetical protein